MNSSVASLEMVASKGVDDFYAKKPEHRNAQVLKKKYKSSTR